MIFDSQKPHSIQMCVDSGQKTWLTPPWIMEKLGHFDLDPCTPPAMPWRTADRMVSLPSDEPLDLPDGFIRTEPADGLKEDWTGKRIWCNPPYGRDSYPFLRKLAAHRDGAIALLFARTETEIWQQVVFPSAHSILFIAGRVQFHKLDGTPVGVNAPSPSALISYSEADTEVLAKSGIGGFLIRLRKEGVGCPANG